jgi:mono/diheme cytochrome c family protein
MKYALSLLVFVAACAHSNAPVATPDDVARAAQRWPGTTADDLAHGRKLFMGHCGSCHQPPRPGDYEASAWPGHIDEMRERAHLSTEETELVEHYVVTVASRAETQAAR